MLTSTVRRNDPTTNPLFACSVPQRVGGTTKTARRWT